MSRADNYSLLLLAGGKSSRMGKDKAKLLYEGMTFLENQIKKAGELGIQQIYLSGYQTEEEKVTVVQDIYPEIGPLGGIHACMRAVKTPYCLILPVDVPQIPADTLENLLESHESRFLNTTGNQVPLLLNHQSFVEPLIGIYPVSMSDFIEKRIQAHQLSVFRMIEAWGYECCHVDLPKWQIANINTQEEYEKLIKACNETWRK